jgi:endonuclease/exonuclease/phosphatase family metal-dependent hydrolase
VCVQKIICFLATSLSALVLTATVTSAQTTVVLDAPDTQVLDGYIRAGSYANSVFDTEVLATKSYTATYTRRALLKFDTEHFVPAAASIQSAILTLTLKSSGVETRTLGAYRVTKSFDEVAATWYRRKSGYNWSSTGADLGSRYATATVSTTPGAKVAFDVTQLVQETVNGTFGSRYTRVALLDIGASSTSSIKEFHSSEATDPAQRPQLVVVYGEGEAPPPPPPPAPEQVSALRVLHWNTHYGGIGTDGRYNPQRVIDWIVRMNPDVISLNEIEKYVSGHGNEDQPALYKSRIEAATGRTWYSLFAQRFGNWSSNGSGNLILSRFPIGATARLHLTCSNRSAALATITVNGRNVNVVSTHIDSGSSTCRSAELQQLLPWLRGFSDQIILAGDLNASINLPYIWSEYGDGWLGADRLDAAVDYPGNSRWGATHNYRIDYITKANRASALAVTAAQVYDTRDANGVRPSDHKPLVVTFRIN